MTARTLFFISKRLGLDSVELIARIAPETMAGIVTIDDRNDARSVLDEIVAFGHARGVPVHVVTNRAEAEALVPRYAPDLVLVVCWYWIISGETLAIPRLGFAGVHASLLPKYRGGSPLVWAIINGEREAGVSLFRFEHGMDDGDLWAQRRFEIAPDAYVSDVIATVDRHMLDMLTEMYPRMLDGSATPRPQVGEPTFVRSRKPSDGLIDWSLPAQKVFDFIRAQSHPYPGAFTFFGDRKVHIWRARISDAREANAIPCGDGQVIVIEQSS